MAVHRILRKQFIAEEPSKVWAFFSGAANLQAITPEYMNFRVKSEGLSQEIYPGMILTYTVSPLLGIPLFWMTEITQVLPGKLFVDEQRRGPYRLWHHEHHFEVVEGGVMMTDLIHYELPLGFLGELVRLLVVRRQLEEIFTYREQKVAGFFPGSPVMAHALLTDVKP